MDNVNVIINETTYSFAKGISLLEISKEINLNLKFPVLVAIVDNVLVELNYVVLKDCKIEFLDCTDRIGNRVYQKGLIFLLNYTVKELHGYENRIKVCHSIDKGIAIKTYFELTEEDLKNIKKKMEELISQNISITRCLVKRKEAIEYFNKIGNYAKARTYLYTTYHYINLYKLNDMYDYFYYCLPINTSVFTSFNLKYIDNRNFILQFPNNEGIICDYINHPKIIEAFDKNYKYSKQLNIFCSADINKAISEDRIDNIIKLDETLANNSLLDIAKDIYSKKDKIKLILISGPSSSGKTTTSKKLAMYLNSFGLNPKPLSLDDYFFDREHTPKLPNGDYDFESIRAIDVDLFNEQLEKLFNYEEASLPTFNFVTGQSEYNNKTLKLQENDIIIVEGLHGLNEELTKKIKRENKYKIYVSALTDLNIDEYNMVSTSDVRLLRRIVRDNRVRGYKAIDTIKSWNRVREGEEKYVFPYQDEADSVYNTALIYEIGVLRLYAEPLLYEIDNTSIYYDEARRLLKFLEMFLCIPTDAIPSDSIIREFIGKSFFE